MPSPDFWGFISEYSERKNTDVYVYAGAISREGYRLICRELRSKANPFALLILVTNGGDPNAGYRIARAFAHTYKNPDGAFTVLVPTLCKSAGTLVCIGADTLLVADTGELGPLDIQLTKPDEMFQRSSGLDIARAIEYVRESALSSFSDYLYGMTTRTGMSTKTAADIATKLAIGVYEPIVGQIDPIRLGETQRANDIAKAYGDRLSQRSDSLLPNALNALINDYPTHGFVIDRKEVKKLFKTSRELDADENRIADECLDLGPGHVDPPTVVNVTAFLRNQPTSNGANDGDATESTGERTEPTVDGAEPIHVGGNEDQGNGGATGPEGAVAAVQEPRARPRTIRRTNGS